MSVNYYYKVLKPENGVVYTGSVDEYETALDTVLTKQFVYKEVFASDTVEKIKLIIEK